MELEDDEYRELKELITFGKSQQQRDYLELVERQTVLEKYAKAAGNIKLLLGCISGICIAIGGAAWQFFLVHQGIKDNAREIADIRIVASKNEVIVREIEKKQIEMDKQIDLIKAGLDRRQP